MVGEYRAWNDPSPDKKILDQSKMHTYQITVDPIMNFSYEWVENFAGQGQNSSLLYFHYLLLEQIIMK